MNTFQNIMLASTLSLSVTTAVAHTETNWLDSAGNYAKDGSGDCVRTVRWKAGTDCAGDAGKNSKAAAPMAAPAPKATPAAPVVKQTAPVKAAPAPRVRELSLASGASFALGGSTLSPAGKSAVAELVGKFKGENIKQVMVVGHTDDRGDASFNQQLSEKRAKAVKAELIANGINANVISTTGLGESRPIASNASREGRAKNRRVEIKIDASAREY